MVDKCTVCGGYMFPTSAGGPHRCPPAWWVWISDPNYDYDRDDGAKIHSYHADHAAQEFAERYDSGADYIFAGAGGDGIQVSVVPFTELDKVEVFTVFAKQTVEYTARKVRE